MAPAEVIWLDVARAGALALWAVVAAGAAKTVLYVALRAPQRRRPHRYMRPIRWPQPVSRDDLAEVLAMIGETDAVALVEAGIRYLRRNLGHDERGE